jgi:hypothetical protein
MKYLIVTIFILFLGSFFVNSYAQSTETTNRTFFVFVQTQIRNSDGQLVAYLEANKVSIPYPERLDQFLDSKHVISTINRGGQNYDVIQVDLTKKAEDTDVISKTVLGVMEDNKPILLAVSDHDGYPIVSGDTITSIWTIIRPAR